MKNSRYILSYDIGTTGLKSCIYDNYGKLIGKKYKEYQTYHPRLGFVEQEPSDRWESICFCTRKLLDELQLNPSEIECICFSGHMNGCILVDKKNI